MLNEKEKGSVGSSPSSLDLFSLITEANMSHSRSSLIHNESNRSTSSASRKTDESDGVKGTLILEGEENTQSRRSEDTSLNKFTVPESVFLPSEIDTLGGQSCTSDDEVENEKSKSTSNTGPDRRFRYYFPPALPEIYTKQLVAHVVASFIVLVGVLTLTAWRSLVWRSEAFHLKEALSLQTQVHSSLKLKIASLEADLAAWNNRHNDSYSWKFEKGHWEIDDEDDNIVLSFKNCYVEASLALGRCSKEWQDWLFGGVNKSMEYAYHDEDEFADNWARVIDVVMGGVAAASSSSFSFVQKTLRQLPSLYYFGDDFHSTDSDSLNEEMSKVSEALSKALKVAESAVDDATFLI